MITHAPKLTKSLLACMLLSGFPLAAHASSNGDSARTSTDVRVANNVRPRLKPERRVSEEMHHGSQRQDMVPNDNVYRTQSLKPELVLASQEFDDYESVLIGVLTTNDVKRTQDDHLKPQRAIYPEGRYVEPLRQLVAAGVRVRF